MSKILVSVLLLAGALGAGPAFAADASDPRLVERGRYVVMIGGCNDCHTPDFTVAGGKLPESQWLMGDRLGWQGAWGTTYAPNLRLKLAAMDLPAWKAYARSLKTRPPMPYWAVNAMSDEDLEALWTFVRSLGPAGEPAPAALPPGVAAEGPVVTFPAPPQAVAAK
jgi:mono/diheme cytochrome c family protein